MNREREVADAAAVLWGTERGRRVKVQLHAFLNGPAASLDSRGVDAVLLLVGHFYTGSASTVLDALEAVPVEGGAR